MLAVTATSQSDTDPLSGLTVGERPDPVAPDGWTTVTLKACGLNHHDLWSLRGVGLPADRLPMILGCDGAGLDEDGRPVIVHSVIADADRFPDETIDPKRTLLSELHDGTLAEKVAVPRRNLVPKPDALSWGEAACLSTAWLTAWRMLFTKAGLPETGGTVLVQGAGGGVSTAAMLLAKAAGHTVFVTSREESKRAKALELGVDLAVAPGERLPAKCDAVIETVGQATWSHSLRSLRAGGTLVVSGATSGPNPPADLNRIFFLQLSVVGSTMGTLAELEALVAFCSDKGLKPLVDSERPLAQARDAFAQLQAGDTFGKLVLTV